MSSTILKSFSSTAAAKAHGEGLFGMAPTEFPGEQIEKAVKGQSMMAPTSALMKKPAPTIHQPEKIRLSPKVNFLLSLY